MAGRPGPALLFAKWVVIPLVVGLTGYFVIGPRIGKVAAKTTENDPAPSDGPTIAHSDNGDTSVVNTPAPTEKTSHQVRKMSSPQPDLDISVRSDGADSVENTPTRANASTGAPPAAGAPGTDTGPSKPATHRRHKPAPKPAAKEPVDDPNTPVVVQGDGGQGDQGGSAGSTTAGGG